MKKKLLMPYRRYCALKHSVAYIFHIQKNGQHIFYFGAKHTFDPKDSQYKKIKVCWETFLKTTEGGDRVALIEGGKRKALKTRAQAIKAGGEMHYVAYLAEKNSVETFSPEPPPRHRYKELLKKFSKKEIAYYDFALVCYQWNRYEKKPQFEKYVSRFLESDKKNSGWKNFDFSLKNMLKIHTEIFAEEFNKNDKQFFSDILDPLSNKSIINKISLFEESGLRDEYIVHEIEKFWKKGKSLFVIYGASHAVRQEAVIRDFISLSH